MLFAISRRSRPPADPGASTFFDPARCPAFRSRVHRALALVAVQAAGFRPSFCRIRHRISHVFLFDITYSVHRSLFRGQNHGIHPHRPDRIASFDAASAVPSRLVQLAPSGRISFCCEVWNEVPPARRNPGRRCTEKDKIESHSQPWTILRFKRNKGNFVDNAKLSSLSY